MIVWHHIIRYIENYLEGGGCGMNETLSSHLPVLELSSSRIHSHQLFNVLSVVLTGAFLLCHRSLTFDAPHKLYAGPDQCIVTYVV